jgi:hypothetical protein
VGGKMHAWEPCAPFYYATSAIATGSPISRSEYHREGTKNAKILDIRSILRALRVFEVQNTRVTA